MHTPPLMLYAPQEYAALYQQTIVLHPLLQHGDMQCLQETDNSNA